MNNPDYAVGWGMLALINAAIAQTERTSWTQLVLAVASPGTGCDVPSVTAYRASVFKSQDARNPN